MKSNFLSIEALDCAALRQSASLGKGPPGGVGQLIQGRDRQLRRLHRPRQV